MDTGTNRPKIQIDDLVREMTDEEYEAWLIAQETAPQYAPFAGDE